MSEDKMMIGLQVDEERSYRAFEQYYHDRCSSCTLMTSSCRIVDCMRRGEARV